ncbi:MAG TPA: hypothetical protein VF469_25225, partial [Kofleriaceae bacterium]
MARSVALAVALAGTTVLAAAIPRQAHAGKPAAAKSRHQVRRASSASEHITNPSDAKDTPAYRYAQLSQAECEAEAQSRHIEFTRETGAAVLAPVRLTGPLHGVVFRTDQPDKVRPTSPYEIADCRLVLALDDFAEILERHDIVEVRHYSMYRPPRNWPEDKIGSQHDGALAIDAG